MNKNNSIITDIPFPLFKITQLEAALLMRAELRLRKGFGNYLCLVIERQTTLGLISSYRSLRNKIEKSLRVRHYNALIIFSTLDRYLISSTGRYDHEEGDRELRIAWVDALLKYNGYRV